MPSTPEKATTVTAKIHLRSKATDEFADWQAKLNAAIAAFPGFISLEILSPTGDSQPAWVIVQRFNNSEKLSAWRSSQERLELAKELKKFLAEDASALQEVFSDSANTHDSVTEVLMTQVSPDKEQAYREWIAKIHQVEAKFPGFRGVYVQSPSQGQGQNWITLLQFDTQENLDKWLSSSEREEVLRESKPLIASLESHRVISPYAGWFRSIAKDGEIPSVWKQTMIILLVLFPIVMLELLYLSPLLANLNLSAATFIGNAISVTLLAWPMVPIAIWFLRWWLSPRGDKHQRTQATITGTVVLIVLYLIEIAIFWNFV